MPDLLQFTDQVVLITGGATGIGRAGAIAFARQGAAVVIGDVDERAAETIDLVEADGGRGLFVKADVATARAIFASAVRSSVLILGTLASRSSPLRPAVSAPMRVLTRSA